MHGEGLSRVGCTASVQLSVLVHTCCIDRRMLRAMRRLP